MGLTCCKSSEEAGVARAECGAAGGGDGERGGGEGREGAGRSCRASWASGKREPQRAVVSRRTGALRKIVFQNLEDVDIF